MYEYFAHLALVSIVALIFRECLDADEIRHYIKTQEQMYLSYKFQCDFSEFYDQSDTILCEITRIISLSMYPYLFNEGLTLFC